MTLTRCVIRQTLLLRRVGIGERRLAWMIQRMTQFVGNFQLIAMTADVFWSTGLEPSRNRPVFRLDVRQTKFE